MTDLTLYVDFDTDASGDGTTGDPYDSIHDIITHFTSDYDLTGANALLGGSAGKLTVKFRNSSAGTEVVTAAADFSVFTTSATYFITLENDTSYEPSGTGPVISISTTTNIATMISLPAYTVVDGMHFKNGYISASRTAVSHAGFPTVRNCMFEGDYAANSVGIGFAATFSNDDGSVIENCLFYDCDEGFKFNDRRADPDIKNCTFADNNKAISSAALTGLATTKSVITGCLFYSNTDDGDETYVATYFGSGSGYNATTLATAKVWTNVANWVESVSTSAGVDIVNAATPDYRAASGGVLDGGDLSTSAPAADMFGTVRPQGANDDIGYYEITGGASIIPQVTHYYTQQN